MKSLLRYYPFFAILIFTLLTGCAKHYPAIQPKCPANLVPVTGFAQALVADTRIQNAKITWLEAQRHYVTNRYGQFQFCAPPGKKMTLFLEKKTAFPTRNYYPTQTSSVIISPKGFVGKYREMSFQVPRQATFKVLKTLMKIQRHAVMQKNACHVVVTVTDYHKTLADDPQGVEGAKIQLWHAGKRFHLHEKPYYFGIIFLKTNPLTPKREVTSADGGVLIFNLPPSDTWYRMSATKKGSQFSSAYFWCRPGVFINVSPPHSPSRIP